MENRETILEEVKKTICKDRNYLYGKPEQSFTEIAKVWSFYLGIDLKAEDAAIMLALFKVARMKTSVSFNKDNFLDAIGYIACAFEVATERVAEENENVKNYVAEVRGEIGEIKEGNVAEKLPLNDVTKKPDCFGTFEECRECLDFCWCNRSCKNRKLQDNLGPCIPACFGTYDNSLDCKTCLYEMKCVLKKNEKEFEQAEKEKEENSDCTPVCFGNFEESPVCLDMCWCPKSCKTKTLSESNMDCVPACFECYDGGTDCKVCLYEEACEEACVESCAVEEKVKEEKPVEEKPKHKKKNKKKNNKKSVDK